MTRINIFTGPRPEDLQPVNWKVVDDAIYDWLNEQLGMRDRIVWENLNEPSPDRYPYLSLLRSSIVSAGGVEEIWRTIDLDEEQTMDPGTQESVINEHIVRDQASFTLSISAYVDRDSDMHDPMRNAIALLSKAKMSLGLNTVRDTLSLAGLSIIDDLTVTDTSIVINGDFVSRATLDIIFGVESSMTERIGFLDKVEVISEDYGVDELVE